MVKTWHDDYFRTEDSPEEIASGQADRERLRAMLQTPDDSPSSEFWLWVTRAVTIVAVIGLAVWEIWPKTKG
jgi:hypothetical protein